MGKTYKEFASEFNKNEIKAMGNGESNGYVDSIITIDKVEMCSGDELPHALKAFFTDKEQPFWFFRFVSDKADGEVRDDHAPMLTRAGDIACYPTGDGGKPVGTLLYDVIHNCKRFSTEQADKLEGWGDEPAKLLKDLKGMKFRMRIRPLGDNNGFILETSRQIIKDENYKAQQEARNADNSAQVEKVMGDISSDDLPFG